MEIPRRKFAKVFCASILFLMVCIRAHADAALLLEEPFGHFGGMNPTGHAAVYLSRVCAASPPELRMCDPGERGVVISRYHRIGGYDWLAIPLIPYLYAVDDLSDVPSTIDAKQEMELRNHYRMQYLMDLAPDDATREIPGGEWIQLVGSSYDRKIYGYQIETSEEQDRRLIDALNERSNNDRFNLFFNNCANFAQQILNFYYPHSIHRNYIADVGLMTPKQAAKSMVAYSKRHPDLKFTAFVIPQVRGTIHRSDSVDGVLESLVKTKKYALPLVALHPVVTGGLVVAYLGDGRFHPDKNAQVFGPVRELDVTSPAKAAVATTSNSTGSSVEAVTSGAGTN